MFDALKARDFQIAFRSHAEAILAVDFPDAAAELEQVLLGVTIPIEELIAGGGGEAKVTQRLRRALSARSWRKLKFIIEKSINGAVQESISHEVDHVRTFAPDRHIALEIGWNNKDPFFDRDLENFKRLHADGAISLGVIVTRGPSLHDGMRDLVNRFLSGRGIGGFEELARWGYTPTARQRAEISRRVDRGQNPMPFAQAFTEHFVADKFGEATTHWRKLEDRLRRGVGHPCPLLLIGLPVGVLQFAAGRSA